MKLSQLKAFLGCTKFNFFFIAFFGRYATLGSSLYDSRPFYGGSLVEFKQDLYLIIGIYKMIWFFFNVIPYWVVRYGERRLVELLFNFCFNDTAPQSITRCI